MSDLRDLYQQLILDHNARPHNFGEMPQATHQAEGFNPLCGDHVVIYLKLDGGVIADVRFAGKGCAISKASASLMTDGLKGKTLAEAQALFQRFHALVTGEEGAEGGEVALGKLSAFAGVREFPMRVKCATLAWHTLRAALDQKTDVVTTE
jgi:nitrogen fixation NifU-like protein